jgi:hypothetical protein
MPDTRPPQSVFTPQIDEGPFKQAMGPDAFQAPQMGPPPQRAVPSRAGGIAYYAKSFMDGLAQGRAKAYATEQLNRVRTINSVNAQLAAMDTEDLNDEGRKVLRQAGAVTLAYPIAEATQPKKGKKGKGGGTTFDQEGGVIPSGGGDEKQQPLGLKILHELSVGVLGGKLPKGYDKIDPRAVLGYVRTTLYQADGTLKPEYSQKAYTEKLTAETAGKQNAAIAQSAELMKKATSQEEARAIGQQALPGLLAAGIPANQAQFILESQSGAFRERPKVGSPEYTAAEHQRLFAPMPSGPKPAEGAMARPGTPEAQAPMPGAPKPAEGAMGAQAGPPAEYQFRPEEWAFLQQTKYNTEAPQQVVIPGADGKKEFGWAQKVTVPGKPFGWYDPISGKQLTNPGIRPATKADDPAHGQAFEVGSKSGNVMAVFHPDTNKFDITDIPGAKRELASPRPASARQQRDLRKLAASEFLSEIITSDGWVNPTGPDGKLLEGRALMKYRLDFAKKHFSHDPRYKHLYTDMEMELLEHFRKGELGKGREGLLDAIKGRQFELRDSAAMAADLASGAGAAVPTGAPTPEVPSSEVDQAAQARAKSLLGRK